MVDEAIDRPIYQQIAIDIANRIYSGEFEEGTRIYGRSTLAGEYNVSPETIRRAMILLQDTNIVDVSHGSGIEVRSRAAALKFIEKFRDMNSIGSLKNNISRVIEDKRKLEEDLKTYIDKLIDYSERFKKSNPFAILEIEIPKSSKLLGKNIAEVNFWQNTGATIIGIRRNNRIILSPGPYAAFREDDVFIMVGDEGSYERINRFINE